MHMQGHHSYINNYCHFDIIEDIDYIEAPATQGNIYIWSIKEINANIKIQNFPNFTQIFTFLIFDFIDNAIKHCFNLKSPVDQTHLIFNAPVAAFTNMV